MKQPLPWIKNRHFRNLEVQKPEPVYQMFFCIFLVGLMCLWPNQQSSAQNINTSPGNHGVNAIGTTQDLTIPNNPQIASITFKLVGGDGGFAELIRNAGGGSVKSPGGNGATTIATFPVGSGSGEIPYGSTIRFVEGEWGISGQTYTSLDKGIEYGGGGGGSAILYQSSNMGTWTLLAVAGGGGGAYQSMSAGLALDSEPGQGGQVVAGNGQGGAGNAASDGGGGGGGRYSDGGGVTCSAYNSTTTAGEGGAGGDGVGHGGGPDGCLNLRWQHGGAGYGGGGAGSGVGGGGGGYTGGAAGLPRQNGGGGSSYVSGEATNVSITAGGTDSSPEHGTITYQVTLQATMNQPPTALCKNATLILDANGNATLTTAAINNGSSDPDGSIVSMSLSKTSFNCSNIGSNQVTLTVTDDDGATATCNATVTVQNNSAPNAVCQNITVHLNAAGTASITAAQINGGSTNNCGSPTLTVVPNTFTCANIGPNNVTLRATDGSGSFTECTAIVTVKDNIAPSALCQNITVQLNAAGTASITAAQINGGSTDNCGSPTLTVVPNTFTCANTGSNNVTLRATDASGNFTECTAVVTVEDKIAPSALCQNITVQLNAAGTASISAAQIDGGSTDNCGNPTLTAVPNIFTCGNVGPNNVTLRATDGSGNFSECTAIVTVEDNVPPDAQCKDITVQLDDMGNAVITGSNIDNGSTDACGIASLTASPNAFTCADVGSPVTVTLTVMDNNGNTSTCTSIVTVEDNVPPDAQCKDITIQLDANGKASIVATDIDNGSTDACGIASYMASRTAFTCANLGNNTVVLTVTDVNGNSATCNANVLVEDNLKPIVRTHNVTLLLDKYGDASVSVAMIDNGSTDNCTIVHMWLEGRTEYDCGSTGVHEVILKARDQSGNVGSYNAFVTVKFFVPDFKNKHNVANGDTIHRVDCQAPWEISRYDLDYETIAKHGTITTHIYKEELPDNPPWGMYAIWRYEYVVKDTCYHIYKFNYYLALYDLNPPIYQDFPNDTTVATSADVPPVDKEVKIIDICQYVVWDTVMTMPVRDPESGDILAYTRRWMARDPSGHQSFRDQMIWLSEGNRKEYSQITGRIASEDHIASAKFAGEAGTNGLPVSLYRLDTIAGTRTWVSSWTTGDWQGAQGTYYFVPEHPGSYQVKIDTAICLVDTLKFNKWLWSDTLEVAAGEYVDQGWVITQDCVEPLAVVASGLPEDLDTEDPLLKSSTESDWHLYPNPADNHLRLTINANHLLSYRLYDSLGRTVKQGVYAQGHTIDIHDLDAGVYHLQLRDQDKILGSKKVLILE